MLFTMISRDVTRRVGRATILLAAVGALALSLVSPSASAADLGGGRRQVPQYEPVEPRMNLERWTGFYLGATVGGNFGTFDLNGDFGASGIAGRGANAGILAGYNWQLGRMVLGVEADYAMTNFDGARNNGVSTFKADMDQIGTLRARLGFLMTPSMMLYATGGLAWADVDISAVGSSIRYSEFKTGWTAGLGTELMISPKWTMRLEYLYTDLGDKLIGVGGQTNQVDMNFHTVRAGLTFKF